MLVQRWRPSKGPRPIGPTQLNLTSPLSRGLVDLFGGGQPGQSAIRRTPVTRVGTFDSLGLGVPSPLGGTLWQYNQGGGNLGGATLPTPGLTASDALTVSTWIYPTQAPGAPRGIWELGTTWSLGLSHTKGTSGTLRAHVVTTSGGAAQYNTGDTTTGLVAFTPLFATVVWNPGAGLTLYINGRSEASNGTTTTGLRDVDRALLYAAPAIETTAGLEGCLCDWRIYRVAMTAPEVWMLYTRYDLYRQFSSQVFFDVGGAPATGWGPLLGQYRNRLVA